MAIVQISRIQHRRGLKEQLPQLAAGELGWAVDSQELYIGNGTVADGAPAVGNTEILSTKTNLFEKDGVGHTRHNYADNIIQEGLRFDGEGGQMGHMEKKNDFVFPTQGPRSF